MKKRSLRLIDHVLPFSDAIPLFIGQLNYTALVIGTPVPTFSHFQSSISTYDHELWPITAETDLFLYLFILSTEQVWDLD